MVRRSDFLACCMPAVLCDCIFYKFDIYIKNFMASFGSYLSHIQDVLKGHWHCHDTRRNLKDI